MKFKPHVTLAVTAALLCLPALSAFAAPKTKSPATSSIAVVAVLPAASAAAFRKSEAEIDRAAVDARRDQDPDVNGSVKDGMPISETRSKP
jgi:hypothetical protein